MYLKITIKLRIELEKLEQQRRMEESDEGLGHSGSSDDEKPVKTENMKEGENMELDENGKRKEDLYQCRYCDRTFCYLCHLKVILEFHFEFTFTFIINIEI